MRSSGAFKGSKRSIPSADGSSPAMNSVACPPALEAASRSAPACSGPAWTQRWPPCHSTRGRPHARRQGPAPAPSAAPTGATGPDAGSRSGKPGQALVAAGVPVGRDPGVVLALAAQRAAGRFHRCHRAAQAQVQGADAGIFDPAAGIERQGLAAPVVEAAQRLGLVAFELQGGFGGRHRQHLEADGRDHAQRAPGTGHQPRHVVAGPRSS
jgi:hypothetical protein